MVMTPDELAAYADVMIAKGLTTVGLGPGVVIHRGDTVPDGGLDPETKKVVDELMGEGTEPSDPRDNPLAYPDGRVPEFPSFDTSEDEG